MRWICRVLFFVGVLLLGSSVFVWVRAAVVQRELKGAFDRTAVEASVDADRRLSPKTVRVGRFDMIGQLTIPRLKLAAFVVEGDDESALTAGIGHLPETPFPWEEGNSGLAGHRDMDFRPLKDVRIGDELFVITANERLRYRIRETRIVNPQDVWVLAPTSRPNLTLITCYPFAYVGHAPRRFIVQADRIGIEPRARPATGDAGKRKAD